MRLRALLRALLPVMCCCLVVALDVGAPATTQSVDAPAPVRVLIVGDSVTQGSAGDWTWRYRLYRHLEAAGVPVDFVGPRTDLWDRNAGVGGSDAYVDPAFDRDHAARWGMALGGMDWPIGQLVRTYQPDVVLELLGFNDLVRGASVATTLGLLQQLVIDARTADPSVEVVLGSLGQDWTNGVAQFDAVLPQLAASLSTESSRVVVAPDPGLAAAADTYDGVHPSATGEVKVAAAMGDALTGLGVGNRFSRPLPVVANGPRTVARLAGTPRVKAALLSWSWPSGADGEYVERRDLSAGAPWSRLPFPVAYPAAEWVAGGLVDGHRYAFRVRSAKGSAIAEDLASNVLRVRPGVPTKVTGLRVAAADHALVASWGAAVLADSYQVRWHPSTAPTRTRTLVTSRPRARLSGLVAGRRYTVSLRGVRSVFEGPWSTVTGIPTAARPAAPSDLAATATSGGVADVSWSAVAGATAYQLRTRDSSNDGVWVGASPTVDRHARVSGLRNGDTYALRVRALDGRVTGDYAAGRVRVPLLAAVTGVTARSPARNRVVTVGRAVAHARSYRLWRVPDRSCAHPPAAAAFREVGHGFAGPRAGVGTGASALWVRWYAVRGGVPGRLRPSSTACTRVR